MEIIYGNSASLNPQLMANAARYRHKVFIEKLGWELPCDNLTENDQFDRSDTIYVIAKNEHNEIGGLARLLPTTRPYLLSDVFPQLLNGMPPPTSKKIWELSRFAAVDFSQKEKAPKGQLSSNTAIELLNASIQCASTFGAIRLITVSPVGIERLLRKLGIHVRRAGPPIISNSQSVCAYWIDLKEEQGSAHES